MKIARLRKKRRNLSNINVAKAVRIEKVTIGIDIMRKITAGLQEIILIQMKEQSKERSWPMAVLQQVSTFTNLLVIIMKESTYINGLIPIELEHITTNSLIDLMQLNW